MAIECCLLVMRRVYRGHLIMFKFVFTLNAEFHLICDQFWNTDKTWEMAWPGFALSLHPRVPFQTSGFPSWGELCVGWSNLLTNKLRGRCLNMGKVANLYISYNRLTITTNNLRYNKMCFMQSPINTTNWFMSSISISSLKESTWKFCMHQL